MPGQSEIQQQITSRILEGLKNGVVPWRKTWRPDKNSDATANTISGRPYSGINPIYLHQFFIELIQQRSRLNKKSPDFSGLSIFQLR